MLVSAVPALQWMFRYSSTSRIFMSNDALQNRLTADWLPIKTQPLPIRPLLWDKTDPSLSIRLVYTKTYPGIPRPPPGAPPPSRNGAERNLGIAYDCGWSLCGCVVCWSRTISIIFYLTPIDCFTVDSRSKVKIFIISLPKNEEEIEIPGFGFLFPNDKERP